MIGFGAIGGMTAGGMAENAGEQERIIAVVPESERAAFAAVHTRLRSVAGGRSGPPNLIIMPASADHSASLVDLRRDADVLAILEGSAAAPRISVRSEGSFSGQYLAMLAETVVREGASATDATAVSRPSFTTIMAQTTGRAAQSGLGYGAVFVIFLLTLILASQSVGMLAEEKSNKIIEILAAAVRLEAVFFGKLVGMLGVATLFIGFWALLTVGAVSAAISQMPAEAANMLTLTPAIGWPLFLIFGLREIQMLSMPITFFQIGMFALSTAAANNPGSGVAMVAQIVPWSSPFAMAARGATDAAILPHLAALGWQALWLAITIAVGVRLFRAGVLRSGGSWWPWAKTAAAVGAGGAVAGQTGSGW